MKKLLSVLLLTLMLAFACTSCMEVESNGTIEDTKATIANAATLQENQPTPHGY